MSLFEGTTGERISLFKNTKDLGEVSQSYLKLYENISIPLVEVSFIVI